MSLLKPHETYYIRNPEWKRRVYFEKPLRSKVLTDAVIIYEKPDQNKSFLVEPDNKRKIDEESPFCKSYWYDLWTS